MKYFTKIQFLLFALLAFSSNIYAQMLIPNNYYEWTEEHYIGIAPEMLFFDEAEERMYAFCLGKDVDHNNEYEPEAGDELPSWWVITYNVEENEFLSEKVFDFEFNSINTFNNASIDWDLRTLYIPHSDYLKSYSIDTYEILNDEVVDFYVESVYPTGGGHLLLTVNDFDFSNILLYSPTFGTTLATVEAGYISLKSVSYITQQGQTGIGVIGYDENLNGTFMYGTASHQQVPVLESIELTSPPTHIYTDNNYIVITMEFEYSVAVFDVNTEEINYYHIGTNFPNYPRGVVIRENYLYVSTFNGDIRVINLNTGNLVNVFPLDDGYGLENLAFWGEDYLFGAVVFDFLVDDLTSTSVVMLEKTDYSLDLEFLTVNVGKTPLTITIDEQTELYHVICSGYDANFNDVYEPEQGDEMPSWWVLKVNSHSDIEATKVAEFDFRSIDMPYRPAFDFENRVLYLPFQDRLSSYDLDNYDVLNDFVTDFRVASVFANEGHLLLTTNPNFGEPGRALVYNPNTGITLSNVEIGPNAQDIISYTTSDGKMGMAVINVGDFGSENSTLMYATIEHQQDPVFKSIPLGMTANHLTFENDFLVATVNHSNKVVLHNIISEETTEIYTGTTGWDGPRESFVTEIKNNGYLNFVTTDYDGSLRVVDTESESVIDIYTFEGKLESLHFTENKYNYREVVAVTVPFNNDYSPSTKVYFLFGGPTTSVKEYVKKDINFVSVFPNPTNDQTTLKIDFNEIPNENTTIEIISIRGSKVAEYKIPYSSTELEISANALGLASGTYIVRINTGKNYHSVPLVIAK